MIAQRFRPLGWVVGVAVAATALYIVSLQVATERTRLEVIDRRIAATKRDIRQLQTELGTRASLRQLERWNGEVLALSTPESGQFLASELALGRLDGTKLPRSTSAPPPVTMVAFNQSAPPPVDVNVSPGSASQTVARPSQGIEHKSLAQLDLKNLKTARIERAVKPQQVAMLDRTLVDHRTLGDIMREAAFEAQMKDRKAP